MPINPTISPDGTGSDATTMPFERVKITRSMSSGGSILGFTVTDEDGLVYTFDQTETVAANSGSGQLSYTSAWQLSKIQGNKPDELVQLYYGPLVGYNTTNDIADTQTINDIASGECTAGPGATLNFSTADVTSYNTVRLLQEVVFPGGKLTFVQEAAARADIPGSTSKALDYIDIYGVNVATNTFQRIKRVDLQQGYFPATTPSLYDYWSAPLKLNGVQMQDINLGIINSYQFEYNMTQNLPGFRSRSRDIWGYYNGAANPTTLIPTQTVTLYGTFGTVGSAIVGGANRNCSEAQMQAWVLNKITYPTGGMSRFFYESNRYQDPTTGTATLAGGLRVTRIETQASAADPIHVKSYKYGTAESGYGILNTNLNKSIWSAAYTEWLGPDCRQQTRVFGSNPTSSINPFDGSPVTYPEVAEYEGTYSSGVLTINGNGKTVYNYRTGGDVVFGVGNNSGKTYVASYHWDRGQLESKRTYNQAGQLIHKLVNTYINPVKTNLLNVGVLVFKSVTYTPGYVSYYTNPRGPATPCEYLTMQYVMPTYFPWPKGNIRLSRTDEYSYPAANANVVQTSTQTSYNGDFQPVQQTTTAADGSVQTTISRYPTDLTIPTPASGPTRGFQLLRDRGQRNVVIESYRFRQASATDVSYLTGGQINLFEENSLVPGYALPKESHLLQVLDRSTLQSAYVPMTLTSSLANKDARYGLELTYTAYDSRANPLEYLLKNGLRVRLGWSQVATANNNTNTVFSYLTSETSNYNTVNSLTTQYSYDVPLLGLKTRTDPNGQATRYAYDAFGRLDAIRDHDQNLLQTYDYNYAQGEQNPKRLAAYSTVKNAVGIGCFLIYNTLSGKVMQAMTDNTVQQQLPVGGLTSQIWRFDQPTGGPFRLTVQNGSGLVAQANSVNNGELVRAGAYTGSALQLWNFTETTTGSGQYRVSLPAGTTWDVAGSGTGPALQLYGNMNNPGDYFYTQPFRFFQLLTVGCPGCYSPIPTLSASPSAICPGQTATLTAAGCTGGTITWSTGAVGNTLVVNNGGTYQATCTLNGCTSTNGQVILPLASNCTGGSPVGNGCFMIKNVLTGNAMQVMGDNTVQQQTPVTGLVSQIWKLALQSNGQYSLTTQNGSNQVASVISAGNGQLVQLSTDAGTALQRWNFSETAAGSSQYRVSLAAGNTWDMRSRGVDPQLQLYGSMFNTTDPDYAGTYRIFKLTAATCPTSPNCYSLRLAGNGKRLTNAAGILKIQDPDDTKSGQIWRIDPVGSSVKVVTMTGAGTVIGAAGGSQTLNTDLVLQTYSGQSHQLWTQQLVNDGNPGNKYGFVTSNGGFVWSSAYNWGAGDPSPSISDFRLSNISDLPIWGTMKWFLDSRVCPY